MKSIEIIGEAGFLNGVINKFTAASDRNKNSAVLKAIAKTGYDDLTKRLKANNLDINNTANADQIKKIAIDYLNKYMTSGEDQKTASYILGNIKRINLPLNFTLATLWDYFLSAAEARQTAKSMANKSLSDFTPSNQILLVVNPKNKRKYLYDPSSNEWKRADDHTVVNNQASIDWLNGEVNAGRAKKINPTDVVYKVISPAGGSYYKDPESQEWHLESVGGDSTPLEGDIITGVSSINWLNGEIAAGRAVNLGPII